MPKKQRSRALFAKADGSPMLFSLVPCSERKEIRELIEYGGGVLVPPEKVPDAIRLVPSSVTVTDSSDDVFSANYIRACAKRGKLLRLIEFKIPMAPAVVDASDSKTRRLHSTRSRREYTPGEEIAIAEFVAKNPGVHVHGNAVYKEMASAGVLPGKHSWQSLKEHYLKNIFPVKHLYESPHEVNVLSGKQSSESAGDRGSSPLLAAASSVIVEDSDSEQEAREPQRPSGSGLQDEGAPAEVVAETESSSPLQSSGTSPDRARIDKESDNGRELLLFASPSAKSAEKSSESGLDSPLAKKNDPDHSTSTSDQGSTAVALRKHSLPTPSEVLCKKQKELSISTASVCVRSRHSLRKASTSRVDVPDTPGQEPILNEERGLRSSLEGKCKNSTPRKQRIPRHMKSGSQISGIGRSARTTVSESRNTLQRTPVKFHTLTPVKPNSAALQDCSSSHLGKQPLPASSGSSILGDVVKCTPCPSRHVPLRISLRKRPNTPPQELTNSHSNSQSSPKSSGDVAVMPKVKRGTLSPGRFHGGDSGAMEGLFERTPFLSRQPVARSSPRKRQSPEPQKDCGSHSSTWRCCESADDTMPDPEDLLPPSHARRRLLPCPSPANSHKKKVIPLRSEHRPDSVSSTEYKCTDHSHTSNSSPRKQRKIREEGHNNVSHQNPSPSSSMPTHEMASSATAPSTRTSSGIYTRSCSLLQQPSLELGLRAPTAKTTQGRKKGPRAPPPPQCGEDGHSSSASQAAGTGKNHSAPLGPGAEVEDLDSADEDLLMEALLQETALRNLGPMPGVAEVHPVGATKEAHRDDVSLQKPSLESGLRAPTAKTARGSKKAPQAPSLPQYGEDGHSSSASQGAGRGKNQSAPLGTGAEVEDLDSADEDLLMEALLQEAALRNLGPMPGVAEVHPVGATKEAHRDDVSLQKPSLESGLRAPTAKTARGSKKAPQAPSLPQYGEDGHSSSASQGAGTGKNQSAPLGTGAEVEDLDSADEDLLMEALLQEAAVRNLGPIPGVAETHPVGATKEAHRDNRSDAGSPASTLSVPSTVIISDSGHSPDEDSTPEFEQDEVSKVRRRLVRLLGMLREGKNTESHETCPAHCGCPRTTRYHRTVREVISLSAFLAYHGEPLPSESPGIEDPEIALLIEILLRDREGRDKNEQDGSGSA
ncbi:uncharacterized protein LOC144114833 [Amblyomma americanum]